MVIYSYAVKENVSLIPRKNNFGLEENELFLIIILISIGHSLRFGTTKTDFIAKDEFVKRLIAYLFITY